MASAPEAASPQPTVLLVEDDAALRRLLSRTLGCDGFGVLEAENGQEALQSEFAKRFRALYPPCPFCS